jgi:hypothetical protein
LLALLGSGLVVYGQVEFLGFVAAEGFEDFTAEEVGGWGEFERVDFGVGADALGL